MSRIGAHAAPAAGQSVKTEARPPAHQEAAAKLVTKLMTILDAPERATFYREARQQFLAARASATWAESGATGVFADAAARGTRDEFAAKADTSWARQASAAALTEVMFILDAAFEQVTKEGLEPAKPAKSGKSVEPAKVREAPKGITVGGGKFPKMPSC